MKPNTYKVIGLMSGTSLDGVDIAFCNFIFDKGKWDYAIVTAETIPYSQEWKERLSTLENKTAFEFALTDAEYGHFLGQITSDFIHRHAAKPDFIASHGHTIFHQPGRKLTSQIGKGSAIAAETGFPVVCDFRSTDVALGGQGAPLVPVGDMLLFSDYNYCLNLGGFANISYDDSGRRIAFDICPANIVLNHLSSLLKKDYDENGDLARRGLLYQPMLDALNDLDFYHVKPPKSLGKEWVLSKVHPLLNKYEITVEDKLRTFVEHIAVQVASAVFKKDSASMLVTGGGAFNSFLVERIRERTGLYIMLPDPLVINFKEALIFAFLGVLRWREEVNCLSSYTGAFMDNIGGAVYLDRRHTT
ncbi:MAG: anhydro-N-acetylmuramic acid kinase [Bacteroidetes bacterium]|nr:anhydro-N-acetylmuramic acid kinase [Bacteroidota bacterium]